MQYVSEWLKLFFHAQTDSRIFLSWEKYFEIFSIWNFLVSKGKIFLHMHWWHKNINTRIEFSRAGRTAYDWEETFFKSIFPQIFYAPLHTFSLLLGYLLLKIHGEFFHFNTYVKISIALHAITHNINEIHQLVCLFENCSW